MTTDSGSIHVRHPLPHDPVGQQFLVAGLASGHEADIYYRVRDSNDNELAGGRTSAGAMSMRDFHHTVDLGEGRPNDPAITLEVFWASPADPEEDPLGPERDKVQIPLTLAAVFYPDFIGWSTHTVTEGETLSSIARDHWMDVTADQIFQCNRDLLSDPDTIRPGQVLRIPGSA